MTATDTLRSVTITVPIAPSPALAPNRIGSRHWRYRQQAAKELREAARLACFSSEHRSHNPPGYATFIAWEAGWIEIVTVHEHIVWPKGARLKDRDSLATYCKPALDGIVDAGIIASDGPKHVVDVTTSQSKGDDASGRIEIQITEVME